jgi:hypothetical protein
VTRLPGQRRSVPAPTRPLTQLVAAMTWVVAASPRRWVRTHKFACTLIGIMQVSRVKLIMCCFAGRRLGLATVSFDPDMCCARGGVVLRLGVG